MLEIKIDETRKFYQPKYALYKDGMIVKFYGHFWTESGVQKEVDKWISLMNE